jgi:short-subunit dehydrogenase
MSKLALITGANKGIGFESARQLGQLGFELLLGARDATGGAAAATQLRAQGVIAEALKTDMGGQNAPVELVDGTKTSVALATLGPDGPSGRFLYRGQELPW